MFKLYVHEHAQADLEELWSADLAAAARIAALLQELKGNQDLLDRLTQHDFGRNGTAAFHVSMFQEQQRKGRNLWRVKLWDLEHQGLSYRVVYAFVAQKHIYHVLAIAPRRFNYDERHPLTQRIIRDCDEL